jgi:hypothetical protein
MLAQVLIAEAASFIAMWKDLRLRDGRDRIVRHGHGPHRANHSRTGCRADCLTAGTLKPSADRLLRHSTSAEVYRDWFLSNQSNIAKDGPQCGCNIWKPDWNATYALIGGMSTRSMEPWRSWASQM